jgi:isoquinoline 1-oxidoreductase subunit beta
MNQSAPTRGVVTRREFLQTATVASGGLVLALSLAGCSKPAAQASAGPPTTSDVNAWLRIGSDDTISFLCDRSEMGQGVYTALPMLLAEELGVPVGRVQVSFAPPGDAYVNSLIGAQVTGGSTSIRDAWPKLRKAGAQAREMLVAAAAAQWQVPVADCRVEDGVVLSNHGKRLPYGAVAAAAAKLPVPAAPKLKAAADFTIIGRAQARLDTPGKVDGSAVYGIDVRLPGMVYAALAQCPTLGGSVGSVDDAAARAMPGVQDVVRTRSGVAVVAASWWQAHKACGALKIRWDAGPNAALDNAAIRRGLRRAASAAGIAVRGEGDVEAALAGAARAGGKVLRAEYELPLLAHATMEPQNCTASVTAEGCEIWVPTQLQGIAQATAAAAAGLEPSQVKVNTTFLGGGFGRRLEVDFIPAAVEVAKAVGKPVKLLWSREDDTTHDAYRPPAFDQVAGALDREGRLQAWKLHLVGPSITERVFPGAVPAGTADPFSIEAAANFPYDVPNVHVDYLRHEIGINVGYWRSVSHALNCFVAESFMDELAAAAGKHPGEFRLALLRKQPRYRHVLETVLRDSNFDQAPAGRFHGVALMEGYGTYMAQVAEVSIDRGVPQVHRIWCAADCGQVVNPRIVVSQVESAVIFGLTAALWGQIDLREGQVQQRNFDRYRLMRFGEVPRIDTYVVDSGESPGGIGEPATALVAPAVCNAIFAATGQRLRSLPIAAHRFA